MESIHSTAISYVPETTRSALNPQDRREVLKGLAISEQWKLIAAQPRYMRAWHLIAGTCSGLLVLIVYVFGWRRNGASALIVLPPCLYSMGAFATVIGLNTLGLISPVNTIGPIQGVLQMFYFIFPLFQPVSKVDTACPICSE